MKNNWKKLQYIYGRNASYVVIYIKRTKIWEEKEMSKKTIRLIAKCIACMFIVVELMIPFTDFPDPIIIAGVHTEITC